MCLLIKFIHSVLKNLTLIRLKWKYSLSLKHKSIKIDVDIIFRPNKLI